MGIQNFIKGFFISINLIEHSFFHIPDDQENWQARARNNGTNIYLDQNESKFRSPLWISSSIMPIVYDNLLLQHSCSSYWNPNNTRYNRDDNATSKSGHQKITGLSVVCLTCPRIFQPSSLVTLVFNSSSKTRVNQRWSKEFSGLSQYTSCLWFSQCLNKPKHPTIQHSCWCEIKSKYISKTNEIKKSYNAFPIAILHWPVWLDYNQPNSWIAICL